MPNEVLEVQPAEQLGVAPAEDASAPALARTRELEGMFGVEDLRRVQEPLALQKGALNCEALTKSAEHPRRRFDMGPRVRHDNLGGLTQPQLRDLPPGRARSLFPQDAENCFVGSAAGHVQAWEADLDATRFAAASEAQVGRNLFSVERHRSLPGVVVPLDPAPGAEAIPSAARIGSVAL